MKFDVFRKQWYNPDTVETIISNFSGQMIQSRQKMIADYGEINPNKSILIGSKSLPKFIKVIYLLDATKTQFPVELDWNERDGVFFLMGISSGNGCYSDMWELSTKHIGENKYENVIDFSKIDMNKINMP